MKLPSVSHLAAVAAALACGAAPLFAAEAAKDSTGATEAKSVQAQLDELRAGQERILRELEEVKALLRAKAGGGELPSRPADPPMPVSVNVHGEPFKGDARATVAILEYSDFDCDFCGRWATTVYPKLREAYVETGKVKFFFRDLPEPAHAEALLKARLARCAGLQGRFWEMHDLLFAERRSLAASDFTAEARAVGIDHEPLAACLRDARMTQVIQRSAAGAARMGIRGTPTFLVGVLTDNGDVLRVKKMLLGAEEMETFQPLLDGLLAGQAGGTKNP